jgi:hypothetical protein
MFFMNQFLPQPLSIPLRLFSIFFENLRRYSLLKVHHWCHWHQWQMEKISSHKSFQYFVWTPLGKVNICSRYIFFFWVTLRCKQPDIVPIICHNLCCSHQWQISRFCRWYQWQLYIFVAGFVDIGGKFATDINDTCGTRGKFTPSRWHQWQICQQCRWYWWCSLTCEYKWP